MLFRWGLSEVYMGLIGICVFLYVYFFLNGIRFDRTFILYILGGEQKQYFLHSYVFIYTVICFFLAYPQKMLMLKPTIDG